MFSPPGRSDGLKEANEMSTEREILVAQKAAMFDLIQILKQQPDKTYTVEELEALIVAYIKGAEQI
jgi:hypothetical protein